VFTSWTPQPREYNGTPHALKRAAQSTQQELAGVAERDIRGRARWAAVLAFAEQDTSYWMTVNGDSETGGLTTRAV
jgi:hypothetical protein